MGVEVPPWVRLVMAERRRRQRGWDPDKTVLALLAHGPDGRDPHNAGQPIFSFVGYLEAREGVGVGTEARARAGMEGEAGSGAGTGAGAKANTAPPSAGWLPMQYAYDTNYKPDIPMMHGSYLQGEWALPAPAEGPGPRGPVLQLSGPAALHTWLLATALIALVLILVRAFDRCRSAHIKFSPRRQRRSNEWSAPGVASAGEQDEMCAVMIPDTEGAAPLAAPAQGVFDVVGADHPPPYWECGPDAVPADGHQPAAAPSGNHSANATNPPNQTHQEDLPPEYSDAYVEYSHWNGIPSVSIYSRRKNPLIRRDIVAPECYEYAIDNAAMMYELGEGMDNFEISIEAQGGMPEDAKQLGNNEYSDVVSVNDNDATLRHADRGHVRSKAINTYPTNEPVGSSNDATFDVDEEENMTKDGEVVV